ncbi:MAG: transposase, partial [Acidobacteriota bacterium]
MVGETFIILREENPDVNCQYLAILIRYEIDEIERFSCAKKLYSYAGLIPSTYASGERTYHGR